LLNKRVAFLTRRKQLYLSLKLRKKISPEKNLKFPPYLARDCDILVDGDADLRAIGVPLDGSLIATPGHTVDSISILFPDGDCLVGDAAASMLGFAGTHNCVIFVCDLDEYYRSWQKLIAAGARRIYPAHGKPFGVERLKANLGRNEAADLVPYS
jgi:glyoxylase-like metal-dependent hydrolase (beta-lactamase superfamily II)